MKPYLKDLLIIALTILCFVIGCHWEKQDVRENSTTDTVYVKGKETVRVDTVKVKLSVNNPKPIVTRSVDTMYLHDTIWCDSLREYELKNDTVQINTTVQGKLIKQTVLYTMYNTSTKRVDTVFVTKTQTIQKRLVAPTFGLRIDSVATPSIGLMLSNKKGNIIYGGSIGTKSLGTLRPDEFQIKIGINLNK